MAKQEDLFSSVRNMSEGDMATSSDFSRKSKRIRAIRPGSREDNSLKTGRVDTTLLTKLTKFLSPTTDRTVISERALSWSDMVILSLETARIEARKFYRKMLGGQGAGNRAVQSSAVTSASDAGYFDTLYNRITRSTGELNANLVLELLNPKTKSKSGMNIDKAINNATMAGGKKQSIISRVFRLVKLDPDKPLIAGDLTVDEMTITILEATRMEARRHHKILEKGNTNQVPMGRLEQLVQFFAGGHGMKNLKDRISDMSNSFGIREGAKRAIDKVKFMRDPKMQARMAFLDKSTARAVFDKGTAATINSKIPNQLKIIGDHLGGIHALIKSNTPGGGAISAAAQKASAKEFKEINKLYIKSISDKTPQDRLRESYLKHRADERKNKKEKSLGLIKDIKESFGGVFGVFDTAMQESGYGDQWNRLKSIGNFFKFKGKKKGAPGGISAVVPDQSDPLSEDSDVSPAVTTKSKPQKNVNQKIKKFTKQKVRNIKRLGVFGNAHRLGRKTVGGARNIVTGIEQAGDFGMSGVEGLASFIHGLVKKTGGIGVDSANSILDFIGKGGTLLKAGAGTARLGLKAAQFLGNDAHKTIGHAGKAASFITRGMGKAASYMGRDAIQTGADMGNMARGTAYAAYKTATFDIATLFGKKGLISKGFSSLFGREGIISKGFTSLFGKDGIISKGFGGLFGKNGLIKTGFTKILGGASSLGKGMKAIGQKVFKKSGITKSITMDKGDPSTMVTTDTTTGTIGGEEVSLVTKKLTPDPRYADKMAKGKGGWIQSLLSMFGNTGPMMTMIQAFSKGGLIHSAISGIGSMIKGLGPMITSAITGLGPMITSMGPMLLAALPAALVAVGIGAIAATSITALETGETIRDNKKMVKDDGINALQGAKKKFFKEDSNEFNDFKQIITATTNNLGSDETKKKQYIKTMFDGIETQEEFNKINGRLNTLKTNYDLDIAYLKEHGKENTPTYKIITKDLPVIESMISGLSDAWMKRDKTVAAGKKDANTKSTITKFIGSKNSLSPEEEIAFLEKNPGTDRRSKADSAARLRFLRKNLVPGTMERKQQSNISGSVIKSEADKAQEKEIKAKEAEKTKELGMIDITKEVGKTFASINNTKASSFKGGDSYVNNTTINAPSSLFPLMS